MLNHLHWDIPDVAPYTGAWIEIEIRLTCCTCKTVAPYTGAWIEINSMGRVRNI